MWSCQRIRQLDDTGFYRMDGKELYYGEFFRHGLAKMGASLGHLDPKRKGRARVRSIRRVSNRPRNERDEMARWIICWCAALIITFPMRLPCRISRIRTVRPIFMPGKEQLPVSVFWRTDALLEPSVPPPD